MAFASVADSASLSSGMRGNGRAAVPLARVGGSQLSVDALAGPCENDVVPNDEQPLELSSQILAPPFLRDVVLEISRLGKFARMTAVGLMFGRHLATLVEALQH